MSAAPTFNVNGVTHDGLADAIDMTVNRADSVEPCTAASTTTVPVGAPTVTCVRAVPLLSVCARLGESVALPAVTTNVTVAPATGVPTPPVTFTTRDCARADPEMADWPLPLSAVTALGATFVLFVGPAAPPHPAIAALSTPKAHTSVVATIVFN